MTHGNISNRVCSGAISMILFNGCGLPDNKVSYLNYNWKRGKQFWTDKKFH